MGETSHPGEHFGQWDHRTRGGRGRGSGRGKEGGEVFVGEITFEFVSRNQRLQGIKVYDVFV